MNEKYYGEKSIGKYSTFNSFTMNNSAMSMQCWHHFNDQTMEYSEKEIYRHKSNEHIDVFPENTKKIIFGSNFNQPIDNIPPHINEIVFGSFFDQSVF